MTVTPRIRTERLIILSRAGLASFSWLAGWLDPLGTAGWTTLTQWILVFYVGYSWSLIVVLKSLPLQTKMIGLVSHIFDVLIFTVLVAITQGSASPFFSYFVFALFAAALRWQKPGILWSGLAFLCLYSGTGILLELNLRLDNSGLELNRFIIRNVHLIVVSLLLIYLTTYEKQLRTELSKLSEWPLFNAKNNDLESFIYDTLSYAAQTLETPRILLIWDEGQEPVRNAALLTPEHFSHDLLPPQAYGEALGKFATHFLCNAADEQPARTLFATSKGLMYRKSPPLSLDIIRQYQISGVIGLALKGQYFNGLLLLLDKRNQTVDDLNLGILAAQQVALRMDQFFLHREQQNAAAIEERIKMARNLHDGVLQTLTGIALQVKTMTRTLDENPAHTLEKLETLQSVIHSEQHNLRQFIQGLKPASSEYVSQVSLNKRLQELATTIRQQWGVHVRLDQHEINCPASQIEDIYHLIREALINCARHADADQVELIIQNNHGLLDISIADNGHGFPFTGKYDLAELKARQLGPKTILERLAILQGSLCIDSQPHGSTLTISLPVTSGKPQKTSMVYEQ